MKKILLLCPIAAVALTGCVAYQPGSTAGYGYSYDYQVPVAEGIPAPVYSAIPEPRRTTATTAAAVPVVADLPPPPNTPPIYSQIPEMTPRERVIEKQTTIYVPQQPRIIEGAGAQPGAAQPVVQQPIVVAPPQGYPNTVYSGINTNTGPIPTNGITPVPTNGIPPVPTNGVPTNGIPTNGIPTNGLPPFGAPRGTNINEGAGAQPNIPQPLEPAPRLPAQPTLPPGADEPGVQPNQGAQQQQQQQQAPPAVPNPAPVKTPFSPAAVPASQVRPAPPAPPAPPQ